MYRRAALGLTLSLLCMPGYAAEASRFVVVPWKHLVTEQASVIGDKIDDTVSAASCVQHQFEAESSPLQWFYDTLYPWFEASTMPKNTAQLEALLKRADIEQRLRDKTRFIAFVQSRTVQAKLDGPLLCGVGFGGAGCFGAAAAERITEIRAFVYDIQLRQSHVVNSTAQGKRVVLGVLIPIWNTDDTTGSACRDLAVQLQHLH